MNGDAIAQTIFFLLCKDDHFDGKTSELLKKLQEINVEKGLYSTEISVFLNVFSRRLRRRIPMLKGMGIGVSLEHREQGSYCTLARLENFHADDTDDSQTLSSDGNASEGKDLAQIDDTDGRIRKEKRRSKAGTSEMQGGAK